jgi:dienelactone hydrolase
MTFSRITVLTMVLALAPAASAQVLDTPQKVWEGFDPQTEPLEIEALKKWSEGGADYTEMYFTGMTYEGEKVRVYAIYAAPTGKKGLPGILHIHGGGQSASPRWLKFWTEKGYAALTFDFCGKWKDRKKHTLWGKLGQGNMGSGHKLAQATEPSVRVSSWYLWTRIARRALTCLERQSEVDPQRLGIFGVSVGGSIVWPVAGMDRRVKAACAVYGVGWNTYPAELDAPDPKADDPHTKLWRSAMEPESYAPLIQCPILFLDGTNDHHGKMDFAYRTLDSVKAEHRQAFSPHWRHHIAQGQAGDLPRWMDTWLRDAPAWPKTPAATVSLDADGVPRLTLKPDSAQKIKRVDCYYAVENRNPINRFWRSVDSQQQDGAWLASLPVLDAAKPLFAFANVYYENGICLSSDLVSLIPAKLGASRATDTPSLLIDDLTKGAVDWYTRSPGTDPSYIESSPVKMETGPGGIAGVSVPKFAPLHTHKLGDPKWRGPDGAQFQFQVNVRTPRKLSVRMIENEHTKGSTTFTAALTLKPADGWQTITLSAKDFKSDKKGVMLANWRAVQMLELEASHDPGLGPIYTNFRWVK